LLEVQEIKEKIRNLVPVEVEIENGLYIVKANFDEFKKTMGLIVDKPKHGHGSSNDDNTERRFFA